MVSVGIIDYGSGNLHSVHQALLSLTDSVLVSDDPDALSRCDKLVLPGVGAYAACMDGLREHRVDQFICDWVNDDNDLLGICVGHQVLFSLGVEHGVDTEGLGLIPGTVTQLNTARLPHMGWNRVDPPAGSVLFRGVEDQRFYFVHSYAARDGEAAAIAALEHQTRPVKITFSEHGGDRFIAALECGRVFSTQFHPEKSGRAGLSLLSNWLDSSGINAER